MEPCREMEVVERQVIFDARGGCFLGVCCQCSAGPSATSELTCLSFPSHPKRERVHLKKLAFQGGVPGHIFLEKKGGGRIWESLL